ncbi:MAG: hypothetical protein KH452_05555 [Clostridiales bacterium]|nr:hypothetical protein [Clostridiales bacterium]
MPYLCLFANDWVIPVREEAFCVLEEYVETCSVEDLIESLPAMDRLDHI